MPRRQGSVSRIIPLLLAPFGSQLLTGATASESSRSNDQSRRLDSSAAKGRRKGSNRQRVRQGTKALDERAWSASDIVEGVLTHAEQVEAEELDQLPGQSSEWMDIQSGSGYVFARRMNLKSALINSPKAALSKILPRRDSHLGSPPWVPNSSSRLLIGLIITCIVAVGIVTFLLQELHSRWRSSASAASPAHGRRRSSESYFNIRAASHRTVPSSPETPFMSVEEQEEQLIVPPTISRRTSARSIQHEEQDDTDDDTTSSGTGSRRSGQDLHYYVLPFGFGVGYSYGPINDSAAARARLDRMAARKRNRSQSSIVASLTRPSSPTLPVVAGTSSSAIDTSSALRSRARTFKEICKGAIGVGSSSNREEDSYEDWPVTSDLPADPPANGIPLDDFTLLDLGASSSTETVTPYAIPSARVSSPPSPGAAAIARHPLVEHLRREGRSDGERRVGKGTPTSVKTTL